jgi:hypothetical protein
MTASEQVTKPSLKQPKKTSKPFAIACFGLVLILLVISIEIFCSVALIHYYRWTGLVKDGSYQSSALVVIENALRRLGIVSGITSIPPAGYEFARRSEPPEFLKEDDVFGYTANVGVFKHIFMRKKSPNEKWELLPLRVTINPDGSRWTGKPYTEGGPNIFIFGDSFVFGYGVNDEQTFSYLLQAANPEKNVHLFALGGYALPQAYLRFEQIKNRISAADVVIIGYADFYDVRNVAAPSRLRQVDWWVRHIDRSFPLQKIPRAVIRPDGKLAFELIAQNCEASDCNAADPSQEYMTAISAKLINDIATSTNAKVYVLHLDGSKNNPLFAMLDKRIEVISALSDDFKYFIRDDIAGFDHHPGPYWHYAISRLLIDRIR